MDQKAGVDACLLLLSRSRSEIVGCDDRLLSGTLKRIIESRLWPATITSRRPSHEWNGCSLEDSMPVQFARSWSDPELETYRASVVRFIEDEVLSDDAASRQRGDVGHALWQRAGELGLLCTDIPQQYGGAGGDFRHEAVIYEEMARRALSGMNNSVHTIVAHYLLNHGTDVQKEKYLPRMASGELVGAIAMSEPDAGSDLQAVRTRAQQRGDHYVVNGNKTFISNGLLAGLVLLVCKTDPALGARGTSILIVEPAEHPGYRVGRLLDKIGLKAQDTAELFFDDMRVPQENLLGGREGKGFYQLMSDLPYERLTIGVIAVAAMEGAYEATLAYVRERKAFGHAVADFQNTRFRLADAATQISVGRAFIDRCIGQLLSGTLDSPTASMAKLWASETQGRVIDELLQLWGGSGYMSESLVARMYADARVQRIYGGTNEIMREVVSRAL
jgi:acyl-CoA dehydrogenase